MSSPAPAAPEEQVPADAIVAKMAASGELARALVERAFYAVLADQRAAELRELREKLAGHDRAAPAAPSDDDRP